MQGLNSETLSKHFTYCKEHSSVRIELPEKNSSMRFSHKERSMRVPFVVYADFESFITPINTCTPDPNKPYTKQYQKHTPSSFCYYIKCFDEKVYKRKPVTFTATSETDNVAKIIVERLEEDIKEIYEMIKFPKKMSMTSEERNDFNAATVCHIYGEDLESDKVRDHCHITGKYRGAAHNSCDTKYKIPKFFPVVFHNLSGYDSHLFIKKLSGSSGKLKCIPNNEEKYIGSSKEIKVVGFMKEGRTIEVKRELRFIYSFRFMGSSLKDLTDNLVKDLCNECVRLDSKTCKENCQDKKGDEFKCKTNCKDCAYRRSKKGDEMCKNLNLIYSGEKRDLLQRKGVYP